MTKENRYLPLLDDTGNWIARPDLYVLVRMAVRDDTSEDVVWQVYRHMAELSDNTTAELNDIDALLERKFIRQSLTERRHAAMVVAEMLRLSSNGVAPTSGTAIKLVTRHLHAENNARVESSISDQVKRAFRQWRNTSHLEAAFRLDAKRNTIFENDPEAFNSFLAKAKALERFVDGVCAKGHLEWRPWRVPKHIVPALSGQLQRLSTQEQRLVGSA